MCLQYNYEELLNCRLQTRRRLKKNYKKDFVFDDFKVKNNRI